MNAHHEKGQLMLTLKNTMVEIQKTHCKANLYSNANTGIEQLGTEHNKCISAYTALILL